MTEERPGLAERLLDAAFGSMGRPPQDPEIVTDEVGQLQATIEDLKRRNREYFEVIERIEAQRDEWQRMYDEQTRMNMNAHRIYRRQLEVASHQLTKAVKVLNEYLVQDGHEPVRDKDQLVALDDDIGANYAERVAAVKAEATDPIDGKAERARIAEGSDLQATEVKEL